MNKKTPVKLYSRRTGAESRVDEFRKKEIVYVYAYPPQTFNSRYVDHKKSMPYVDSLGVMRNKERLPYWKPEERYIANLEDYRNLLSEIDTEEHVVYCKYCGLELVKFLTEKGMSGVEDGILGLQYTQSLMSYRPREDGTLGLECVCGQTDTRLSTQEKIKYPQKFSGVMKTSNKEEATFNNKNSLLVTEKVTAPIIDRKEVSNVISKLVGNRRGNSYCY